ncbi:ataxin-7-like protein 2b isoform X2 [Myripristis murdjan]|uniref:ataxin-7-like protein 2b isoform X2 n=1 Tax=Myripristis murdjan TaxID=586833 RepID=UPI001176029C|nr:ataxin-7-like protein 2 isoform X2 [Myripristis murdjan]
MVSTRERARAAMAAVDRRNPNLDDFVGLNWSSWIDIANILASDAGPSVEECSKSGKSRTETMTLRKEDMPIYGHCPAHDDFFLVVCSHCGQVVKPQAFEKHCERRHGPLSKLCSQSSTLAPQQRPRPGRPPSVLSSSRERQTDSRHREAGDSATAPVPHHRPAKAQKEVVSLPSVETFPQENQPLPPYSSMVHPRVPPWHSGPLPPGGSSSSFTSASSSEKLPLQKAVAGQSSDPHNPLRGPRTYSRIYKKVDKKECDLDKHCGVLDPERKKLCTRQLMCNIHSIHQRRKVAGRSKTFDQLVMEQRTGSPGHDPVRVPGHDLGRLTVTPKDAQSHAQAPEEKSASQCNKHNFGSNCSILRSGESPESGPEEDGDSAVDVEVQPPYPFNQSLLSSEESEGEEQEEARDLPATPWHPKPLGLCTFGSRTLGCSIFTFDRRLHHLRFALSAMVEHHISTHLWKKMPQVSTGLRSHHVTAATTGSSVRTGARTSSPSGSSSLSPTPSGQSETKSSQHNPLSTKPPSSTTSANLGPGRLRNPVGRPSKSRQRELELTQTASTASKVTKLLHSGEDQTSKHIRDSALHKKGQTHSPTRVYPSPSTQGPINGTLCLAERPCPSQSVKHSERHSPSPLPGLGKHSPFTAPHHATHATARSRGRPPGAQRRAAGDDHRGLAQKRKASSGSPPLSPSLSRTPKSHSSLFSWKGESIGAMLARGLEKRMDSS